MLLLVLTIILGLGLGCRVPSLLRGFLVVPPPRSAPLWSSCLGSRLTSSCPSRPARSSSSRHCSSMPTSLSGRTFLGARCFRDAPRGHHAVANWRTGGASRLRSRREVSCSGLDRSCPCRSSRRRLVTGGPADELPPPRRCRSPRRVLHGAAGGDRPRGLAWPRPRTRSSSCRAPAVPRWDAVEVGAAWAGWSGEPPYDSLGGGGSPGSWRTSRRGVLVDARARA